MTTTDDTLYTARLLGPTIIEQGSDSVITCPLYRSGVLVAPSSGTVTIYGAGNAVIVSAAAVTITSSIATYSVLSTATAGLVPAEGWRIEWTLLLSTGRTRTIRTDGVLVMRRMYPVITDVDLLQLHPELTRLMPPTESNYQDYIDAMIAEAEGRLVAAGRRPWLIISAHALREYTLNGALAKIWRSLATGGTGTREWDLSEHYRSQSAAEWEKLALVYAAETTAAPSDAAGKRRGASPTVWLSGRQGWL